MQKGCRLPTESRPVYGHRDRKPGLGLRCVGGRGPSGSDRLDYPLSLIRAKGIGMDVESPRVFQRRRCRGSVVVRQLGGGPSLEGTLADLGGGGAT